MTSQGDVTTTPDRLTELEAELLRANSITEQQHAELLDITREAFAAGDPHRGFAALWMAEADWGDPDVPARMWAPSGVNPLVSGLQFYALAEDLTAPTIIEDYQVVLANVRKHLRSAFRHANIDTRHKFRTNLIPPLWRAWVQSLKPDASETSLRMQRDNLAFRCWQLMRVAMWCPSLAGSLTWDRYHHLIQNAAKHIGRDDERTAAEFFSVFHELLNKHDWCKWLPLVNYLMERGVDPKHFEAWLRQNRDLFEGFTDEFGHLDYTVWFDTMPTAKEAKRAWLKEQINDLTEQLADLSRDD